MVGGNDNVSISQGRVFHCIESGYDFLSHQFDRGPYWQPRIFFWRYGERMKRTEPRCVLYRIELCQQFLIFRKILCHVESDREPVDFTGVFLRWKPADIIGFSVGLEIGALIS